MSSDVANYAFITSTQTSRNLCVFSAVDYSGRPKVDPDRKRSAGSEFLTVSERYGVARGCLKYTPTTMRSRFRCILFLMWTCRRPEDCRRIQVKGCTCMAISAGLYSLRNLRCSHRRQYLLRGCHLWATPSCRISPTISYPIFTR